MNVSKTSKADLLTFATEMKEGKREITDKQRKQMIEACDKELERLKFECIKNT